jgi:FKBP-type peptidyl-prolyl cis-trans isomerase 2
MKVEKGNKVKVEYEGKLEDGTVFDSSKTHGQPLEFEVGAGQLIKGFDEAVIGMAKDEEKEITLSPAEAYGEPNPQMQKEFPRAQLPPEPEPKVGMVLMMAMANGQQIPAKIKEVKDDVVVLDLNHPLAGKTLVFKIKVVEISS